MKCADGWWWRFPAMCAVVGGFFVALMSAGVALAWVSHVFGGPPP